MSDPRLWATDRIVRLFASPYSLFLPSSSFRRMCAQPPITRRQLGPRRDHERWLYKVVDHGGTSYFVHHNTSSLSHLYTRHTSCENASTFSSLSAHYRSPPWRSSHHQRR